MSKFFLPATMDEAAVVDMTGLAFFDYSFATTTTSIKSTHLL